MNPLTRLARRLGIIIGGTAVVVGASAGIALASGPGGSGGWIGYHPGYCITAPQGVTSGAQAIPQTCYPEVNLVTGSGGYLYTTTGAGFYYHYAAAAEIQQNGTNNCATYHNGGFAMLTCKNLASQEFSFSGNYIKNGAYNVCAWAPTGLSDKVYAQPCAPGGAESWLWKT